MDNNKPKRSKKYRLKKKNTLIASLGVFSIIFIILFSSLNSFFSDNIVNMVSVISGNLSVKLENLKVYEDSKNLSAFATPDDNGETNIEIKPSNILMFSFDVANVGTSGILTDIYLNINFYGELSEKGHIVLYPSNISDEDIIEDLRKNDDSRALIKFDANDLTTINTSAGNYTGIRQKLETRKLDSSSLNGTKGIATTPGESSHYYEYKMVFIDWFYETSPYSNKTLELKVEADAKIHNLTNGNWADNDSDFFKVKTSYSLAYIENGLILLYDATNNSESGSRPDANTWKDLVGTNDGRVIGNPSWKNHALSFDGINDSIRFRGDIPQRYTIISTFEVDPTHTVSYQRISAENPFPSLVISSGQRAWLFGHGKDEIFPNNVSLSGKVQVAMTFNGTSVDLYVNGVYASSIATTTNPTSIAEAMLGDRAANNRQFRGDMYNFMIYDRVLTPSEISDTYEFEVNKGKIPIKTAEQFKKIGSGEIIIVDGKAYRFSDSSTYEVKNDLSFSYNGHWTDDLASIGRINTYDKVVTITNTNDSSVNYYQNQVYVTKDNAVRDGLVLHYDSINNTGTGHSNSALIWKDLVGTNDGILLGGASWTSKSLSFDGIDDKVTFKGDITSNYSLVMTFKPIFTTGSHPRLVAENPFPTLYLHTNTTPKFGIGFFAQGNDAPFTPTLVPSETDLTYIVVTYTANEVKLYVNGKYTGKRDATVLPVSQVISYLGGRGTNDRQYKGEISDFMVYNRALTDFEVERSYITNKSKYN